jgi:hypothetical protein
MDRYKRKKFCYNLNIMSKYKTRKENAKAAQDGFTNRGNESAWNNLTTGIKTVWDSVTKSGDAQATGSSLDESKYNGSARKNSQRNGGRD